MAAVDIRRLPEAALLSLALAACAFEPMATTLPSPTPSATPSPTPTPVVTPSPLPTATAVPTPDPASAPDFAAGDVVASLIDGLRVRQRPDVDSAILTGLLPLDAELGVVMGPFFADGLGWYLVTDADPEEPQFEEGWVAAGYEPEPFLRSAGRAVDPSPFVASFAGTGDAEHGPIEVAEGDHLVRWLAADPERTGCRFEVLLGAGSGEPVPIIRSTVGNDVVPGTLQPAQFAAAGLSGQLFLTVRSDCAWSLVVMRAPASEESPSPSP